MPVAANLPSAGNNDWVNVYSIPAVDGSTASNYENQGMYSRVVGWKDWSYMNSQDDRSDELKYWKDNVDPFVESSTFENTY